MRFARVRRLRRTAASRQRVRPVCPLLRYFPFVHWAVPCAPPLWQMFPIFGRMLPEITARPARGGRTWGRTDHDAARAPDCVSRAGIADQHHKWWDTGGVARHALGADGAAGRARCRRAHGAEWL